MKDKKICLLGLAFKPNTNDIRHAPSLFYIKKLEAWGAEVKVFDPLVKSVRNCCKTVEEAMAGANAVIIATEWEIFKTYDWSELVKLVETNILFDGRNMFINDYTVRTNWKYKCVGLK